MLDYEILKSVLIVSVASSIISTSLVQQIKEACKSTKCIYIYSFIISFIIGITFSLTFSNLSIFPNRNSPIFIFLQLKLYH